MQELPEGVNVGARVNICPPAPLLLRRHEVSRADRLFSLRESSLVLHKTNSEVREEGLPKPLVEEQYVLWLYVAMNSPKLMGLPDPVKYATKDLKAELNPSDEDSFVGFECAHSQGHNNISVIRPGLELVKVLVNDGHYVWGLQLGQRQMLPHLSGKARPLLGTRVSNDLDSCCDAPLAVVKGLPPTGLATSTKRFTDYPGANLLRRHCVESCSVCQWLIADGACDLDAEPL